MHASTLGFLVVLLSLGCSGTSSSGQGGEGGVGAGDVGGSGGTGGSNDGTFFCGYGDSEDGEVRCVEGEEYCFEQYSEDSSGYTICEPLPAECSTLLSTNWCECVLGDYLENCEIVGCDTDRYVECL